jgi:F0F1-type ATP synthase membrane subunit c/vacuolar-type H+-ATPase subunit K
LAPDTIEQPLIFVPDAYPGGQPNDFTAPSSASPPAIGSGSAGDAGADAVGEAQTQTTSAISTVILWIGFVAALMIFIAGVIGSIYYFSRQRSGKS